MNNWNGLVKILEIQHVRNGEVIWENKNVYNTLHSGGELFIITCCFDNDGSFPPSQYYFGLDNRTSIQVSDLMDDLVDEPSGGGYLRQTVSSETGFTIDTVNSIHRAVSQILTFSASTGFGPVSKLFMTTTNGDDGILIASASLSDERTLESGDSFNVRMSLSLKDTSL